MYKFLVEVKGINVSDTVIAKDTEQAIRIFKRNRGISMDRSRLTAHRVEE